MAKPIVIGYGGRRVLLHEAGCTCGDKHASGFGADGRACILTHHDPDCDEDYFQVWYRTGKWTLDEALQSLMQRCGGPREKVMA